MDMNSRIGKGILWNGVRLIGISVLQFAQITVTSSLVSPAEFGTYGVAAIILAFLRIFQDFGFGQSVVQDRSLTPEKWSFIYMLNVAAVLLILIPVHLGRHALAAYFEEPALANYILVSECILITAAVAHLFQVSLERQLDFRRLAIIDLSAYALGTAATMFSLQQGQGAIAILHGILVTALVKAFILLPSGLRQLRLPKQFRLADVAHHLRFARYQLPDRVIQWIALRFDQFIIMSWLGITELGLYALAFQFSIEIAYRILPVFSTVALPALASVADDASELRATFHAFLILTVGMVAPMLFGIAALAQISLPAYWDPTWANALSILYIMVFTGFFRSAIAPAGTLFLACGKPKKAFQFSVFHASLNALLVTGSAFFGSALYVAYATLLSSLITLLVCFFVFFRQSFKFTVSRLLLSLGKILFISWIMYSVLAYIGPRLGLAIPLANGLLIVLGAILYLLLVLVIGREEWRFLKSFLTDKR